MWTSLGETYLQGTEGVPRATAEAQYEASWSKHTDPGPIEPDLAVQKLLYAQVDDRQGCFQAVRETDVEVTVDGSTAFLLVYDDQQDCDSIRDFAALFVSDASAEVTHSTTSGASSRSAHGSPESARVPADSIVMRYAPGANSSPGSAP